MYGTKYLFTVDLTSSTPALSVPPTNLKPVAYFP